MLNTSLKIFALSALLFLAGCGGNSSETSSIPQASDPNQGGTIPTTGTTTDSRLPAEVSTAQAFTLSNRTTFSGLNDILLPENSFVVGPLVGDPKIKLTFTSPISSTAVAGSLFFGFEDQAGFWYMRMNTVNEASVKNSTAYDTNGDGTADVWYLNTDAIYTDNYMTVRILAYSSDNGATQHGYMYYRMRQTGENQCFKQTVTCVDSWGNPLPASFCTYPTSTNTMGAECQNYVTPGSSNVKLLGTF